jgi:peptidoglycan/LPS O-acetylase OafA/YrhL
MPSSRAIPSLDGLRAFSISLVILSHIAKFSSLPGSAYVDARGPLGVSVFFIISGFLITHLLLKGAERTGEVNLKRFYTRRFFRIFPPFYTYLAFLGLLWGIGALPEHLPSFASAATYTWDYYHGARGWFLTHTWSLSVEEQFYLLWPASLSLAGQKRSVTVALTVILGAPLIRLGTYLAAPSLRGSMGTMFHTRSDTLLCGCLLALLYDHPSLKRIGRTLLKPAFVIAALIFLFAISPALASRLRGYYTLSVGMTLESACIALLVLYCIWNPESGPGRVLNSPILRHIGVVSYSLYLWQQFWLAPSLPLGPIPIRILLALASAELSFRLVERPMFRFRDYVETKRKAEPVRVVDFAVG